MSNQNSNIHAHHRQRLRHRFNTYGHASFEEHNMLELILFYAVPYKDTNPIAHNLIRRFGSFYDVFRADPKEMTEVSGVGEYAAEFLRFLNFSSDVAVHQGIFSKSKLPQYKTIDEVGKMLCSHLSSRAGGIYMTLFNSNHELIGTTLLALGKVFLYCFAADFARQLVDIARQQVFDDLTSHGSSHPSVTFCFAR